jgi:DNA end-binding protein Ku
MASKKAAKSSAPVSPTIPIQQPAKRGHGTKLVLQVGMISVPIKLHAGARADRLSFRQLHAKCAGKLKMQSMYCPTCEIEVEREDIVKGYEFRPDEYAIITPQELEAQKPATCKEVEVEQFVDASTVDPIYFETSHYITPGDGGARGYILIRDVLVKTAKVAIAKAVLSGNTEHTVLIRPYNDGLALHTLFYQDELKSLPMPVDQISVSGEEMKLATQLVDRMTGAFDPLAYADSYAANVRSLVQAKLNGTAPKVPERKERKVETDLLAALTASVSTAKKRVA